MTLAVIRGRWGGGTSRPAGGTSRPAGGTSRPAGGTSPRSSRRSYDSESHRRVEVPPRARIWVIRTFEQAGAGHERILALSGSNRGVEPTTATLTGYCSPRYSTSSGAPTFATSGGRYDISRCLPTDGPEPAEVTYERRPFASTSGAPSAERIGSRPSM